MRFSRRFEVLQKDVTQVCPTEDEFLVWPDELILQLLGIVVEVGDRISHALEDDVGAANVDAPFPRIHVEVLGEAYADLGGRAGDDGAFDWLFEKGVDAGHKNLGTISVEQGMKWNALILGIYALEFVLGKR